VHVYRRVIAPDTGHVDFVPVTGVSRATTDERGAYRVSGLPAGKYIVAAQWDPTGGFVGGTEVQMLSAAELTKLQEALRSGSGRPAVLARQTSIDTTKAVVAFAPVYHPSAVAVSDASTVVVPSSQEVRGIDIDLRLAPTSKLDGMAYGPNGVPVSRAGVLLLEAAPTKLGIMQSGSTATDAEGRFSFPAVREGKYIVVAVRPPQSQPISGDPLGSSHGRGFAEVSMLGLNQTVALTIAVGATVAGGVVFEGARQQTDGLDGLRLTLTDSRSPRIPALHLEPEIRADGTFSIVGVLPGTYRLGVKLEGRLAAWRAKSAVREDQDILDGVLEVRSNEDISGLTITLTDRHTEVSGSVRDADGNPVPDLQLIVFSGEKKFWRPASRRTQQFKVDPDGRYLFHDLPSGPYFLIALRDVEPGSWHDPAVLEELAKQNPISFQLAEGEKKVLDIQTAVRKSPY